MAELYLSLGTNLWDRHANIDRALSLLGEYFGQRPLRLSPRIETEAVGFEGPDFINCIVVYETGQDPLEILRECKFIEERMGRKERPEFDLGGNRIYHNRIIDIDILMYGDIRMDTPTLVIPHPQVESRPFVRQLLDMLDGR